MYKFHEEKNQHATSFTSKKQQATSSMIRKRAGSSMNKMSFTRRSVYKFQKEKKQYATGFTNKYSTKQAPRTKSVS